MSQTYEFKNCTFDGIGISIRGCEIVFRREDRTFTFNVSDSVKEDFLRFCSLQHVQGYRDTKTPQEVLIQALSACIGSDAAHGGRRADIAEIGLTIIKMLIEKNIDYGSSVFNAPLLSPNLSPEEAIKVRISDKLARLTNLDAGNKPNVRESYDDTLRDLAGYYILWLVVRRVNRTVNEVAQDLAANIAETTGVEALKAAFPTAAIYERTATGIGRRVDDNQLKSTPEHAGLFTRGAIAQWLSELERRSGAEATGRFDDYHLKVTPQESVRGIRHHAFFDGWVQAFEFISREFLKRGEVECKAGV